MMRSRRWAVVGLLCVCGAVGCAQLPARGLFARRTKPATTDETRTGEQSSLTNEDNDDNGHQRELAELSHRDDEADATSGTGAVGGLFDVSGRSPSGYSTSTIEAPTPKRRANATPSVFTPADQVRELQPGSPTNPNEVATDASSDRLDPRGGVVTADFATSMAGGHSSDIELASAKRRTNGATNPWNRFRDLTNHLDSSDSPARPTIESEPLVSPNLSENRSTMTLDESADTRSRPSTTNPDVVAPPQPWTETLAPTASSNAVNAAATNGAATNNANNVPELWPRAPGASAFNTSANAAVATPNVQWVNAEQAAANLGAIPGFNVSTPPHTTPFAPAGNLPAPFAPPDGAPAAITPFVTSPELERLITQTTVEAAAMTPGDNDLSRQFYLRKHVQLRLLHLISGQMDRALQPVPGIDPADQEFWQQMLWGIANYFDTQGMPDSSERATQTIVQLKTAAARLQEKARLELHNVAFCHKISGFGNYQRFKRDEFTSGQPVLLYAEVANFKSESTPDGQSRTLMKSALEVLEGGPTGRLVESLPLAPSEDRCRNQRRDYYHSYEFAIPAGCNSGPHTLRLRVEDLLGKKTAVSMLNFTVQ